MDIRDDSNDPLVGNPAIAAFVRGEGYPMSTSSMQKHTSPAINTGPELTNYYGKLPVTTKGLVREWIKSRMRPVRACSSAPTAMSAATTSAALEVA
jgi:hypothetical protein